MMKENMTVTKDQQLEKIAAIIHETELLIQSGEEHVGDDKAILGDVIKTYRAMGYELIREIIDKQASQQCSE